MYECMCLAHSCRHDGEVRPCMNICDPFWARMPHATSLLALEIAILTACTVLSVAGFTVLHVPSPSAGIVPRKRRFLRRPSLTSAMM